MAELQKFKCSGCNAESVGMDIVDASRGTVHKDGCSGQFNFIEKVSDGIAKEAETSKKKK